MSGAAHAGQYACWGMHAGECMLGNAECSAGSCICQEVYTLEISESRSSYHGCKCAAHAVLQVLLTVRCTVDDCTVWVPCVVD